MEITKLGHCCLLIEIDGKRILTDPGIYTVQQQETLQNIDAILITHEHADHYHAESVVELVKNNQSVRVITNTAVKNLLATVAIKAEVVEDGHETKIDAVTVRGYGSEHAPIYRTVPSVQNTGYMIAGRLYYPGDAFHTPSVAVDILAVPVAGPWVKISEAIDYCLSVKPQSCFAVHDGGLKDTSLTNRLLGSAAEAAGIHFHDLVVGTKVNLD